jgi:hypothetical protein
MKTSFLIKIVLGTIIAITGGVVAYKSLSQKPENFTPVNSTYSGSSEKEDMDKASADSIKAMKEMKRKMKEEHGW